ncbi:MAG: hypothetical protein HKM23_08570 [Nitrosopumilus sp.]|nr:hypothetical protein [Nitrosopumilus sp.]NNL58532.1 hypothetical protein [Nitrosopumilus sp.]
MIEINKFEQKLQCICSVYVTFELIEEIECDWGSHKIIQCPNCEELFSIDKKCPAFRDILELSKINPHLCSEKDKSYYVHNSHPC